MVAALVAGERIDCDADQTPFAAYLAKEGSFAATRRAKATVFTVSPLVPRLHIMGTAARLQTRSVPWSWGRPGST